MSAFFILLLILQNGILKLFPDNNLLNYWDEAITLVLLAVTIAMLLMRRTVRRPGDIPIVLCTLGIVGIGLVSNGLFMLQAYNGVVWRDLVGLIKFPLVFVCLRATRLDEYMAKHLRRISGLAFKTLIVVMFICAIISIFHDIGMSQDELRYGLKPFQFIFTHPTTLVFSSTLLLALINADTTTKNILLYEIMLLVVIGLSMRTKGVALIGVYFIFKYGDRVLHRAKWLLWVAAFGATYLAAASKLAEYASYAGSPRESLYKGALYLMQTYFPLGSGFGTFGSMLSGTSGSSVYGVIVIAGAWVNGQLTEVLGDAGYAYYLGQFGIFGLLLFGMILFLMIRLVATQQNKLPGLVLMTYLLIALTAESTALNFGVELAVVFAVVLAMGERKVDDDAQLLSDLESGRMTTTI